MSTRVAACAGAVIYVVHVNRDNTSTREMEAYFFFVSGQTEDCIQSDSDC